ncbi:MAG: phosphatidylglycerophosphatase A family protein [Betaproteobacteria bacterium]
MVLQPGGAFAFSHPAHALAFGFGAGLVRIAPGTAATLAAWPVGWFLGGVLSPAAMLALAGGLFLLGIWCCGVTAARMGVPDHGAIVWDEIVAFLLVLAIVPRELGWQAAAFAAFRFFDIAKPPPIRWLERRLRGGLGVMLDDLAAAGFALLALAVAKRLLA